MNMLNKRFQSQSIGDVSNIRELLPTSNMLGLLTGVVFDFTVSDILIAAILSQQLSYKNTLQIELHTITKINIKPNNNNFTKIRKTLNNNHNSPLFFERV